MTTTTTASDGDPTVEARRALLEAGAMYGDLKRVIDAGGPVWDTEAMTRDFAVDGFLAPFVVVRRRSDNVRGTLSFTHRPRYYFDFVEDAR